MRKTKVARHGIEPEPTKTISKRRAVPIHIRSTHFFHYKVFNTSTN